MSSLEDKLQGLAISGLVSGGLALGHKLNLFQALAEVASPEKHASAQEVAKRAKCKSRYVEEWLCLMASADIICVDEQEKFWISPENVEILTSKNHATMFNSNIVCLLTGYNKLVNVVKEDGPLGMQYSDFHDFYTTMNDISEVLHKDIVKELIPLLGDELENQLIEGDLMVLDVGCGSGFQAELMAEAFPKSNFTGIDISLDAVLMANQKRTEEGRTFENLAFIQMDGGNMDEDWTEKYDLIFIFDACHDQMRPDKCLKEIYRVLKRGGTFAMLETQGTSHVYTDKKEIGPAATILYGCSLFHCLPVGSNSPDAIGAGAAWGSKMAEKMLKEAGFDEVRMVDTPQFQLNQLYICKK